MSDITIIPAAPTPAPETPAAYAASPTPWIRAWAYVQAFALINATRNAGGIVTIAGIVWPDGATGSYVTDTINSNGTSVDAWHATYNFTPGVGMTMITINIVQPLMTRDASGNVITQPTITVI